mmetsp:Transcript_23028/g.50156  ORF Transcript_23028/g.50156 Transcript_23028/m.50156 type:complete len:205 (+) Transcript_23028:352-966(+)
MGSHQGRNWLKKASNGHKQTQLGMLIIPMVAFHRVFHIVYHKTETRGLKEPPHTGQGLVPPEPRPLLGSGNRIVIVASAIRNHHGQRKANAPRHAHQHNVTPQCPLGCLFDLRDTPRNVLQIHRHGTTTACWMLDQKGGFSHWTASKNHGGGRSGNNLPIPRQGASKGHATVHNVTKRAGIVHHNIGGHILGCRTGLGRDGIVA